MEENENLEQVKEQNDRYDKILKEAGPGNEKYVGRAMLTFNNALKHKEAETDKIDRIDTGNQVSNSAIWDAFVSCLRTFSSELDGFFRIHSLQKTSSLKRRSPSSICRMRKRNKRHQIRRRLLLIAREASTSHQQEISSSADPKLSINTISRYVTTVSTPP